METWPGLFHPTIGIALIYFLMPAIWTLSAVAATPNESARAEVDARSTDARRRTAATFFIQEYRVQGAHLLSRVEIEEAVYPFLGPGRTADDVEQARSALEKVYKEKGYETVSVQVPEQDPRRGIIQLQVVEARVSRLRVKGSRYYSLDEIKRQAPSVAEGRVVDFNRVSKDIVALNQWPDRRITPSVRAGAIPGTVDVDLTVADTLPLHGSLELNNRYSANTTPLRLNGAVSYNNLWQLGHSVGMSFQVAPERIDDAKVFSGYYTARFGGVPWLSLTLQGTSQDSNVSTLGGAAVAGKGSIIGGRLNFTLPNGKDFVQSLSLGVDYKRFDQNINIGGSILATPITYFPFGAQYFAGWSTKEWSTDATISVTFSLRGLGSSERVFDAKRFKGSGSFIYVRGSASHTRELPGGFQLFGQIQGQAASGPLPDSEESAGGGLSSVRGYLESTVLGDNSLFGALEFRSPSLAKWTGVPAIRDLRIYVFLSGGVWTLNEPLPEQASRYYLTGYGVGARLRALDHFYASIDVGVPIISQGQTRANDVLATFQLGAEF